MFKLFIDSLLLAALLWIDWARQCATWGWPTATAEDSAKEKKKRSGKQQ
jgi:hypothetical protein